VFEVVCFLQAFLAQNLVRIFNLFHVYYTPHTSHTPWFDQPNTILWKAQIMKLLIMGLLPSSEVSTLFSNSEMVYFRSSYKSQNILIF
jgi:hypothetical protein